MVCHRNRAAGETAARKLLCSLRSLQQYVRTGNDSHQGLRSRSLLMVQWSAGARDPDDWLPEPLLRALEQPSPAPETIAEGCRRLEATLAALGSFVPPPLLDRYLADPAQDRSTELALPGTVLS